MIRWSYLVPRLLLVAALGSAYWFGLNPLVRKVAIWTGQAAVLARVEIQRADASLAHTEVQLHNVKVADPKSPMKNLFEADTIALSVETGPLLHRRFIVDEGRITRLRLDTPRQTSGELGPLELPKIPLPSPKVLAFARKEAEELTKTLLDRFAALVEHDVRQQAEQLESIRLARELLVRWPGEFAQLEARADAMKHRAAVLKQALESQSNNNNVAQNIQRAQQVTAEMEALRRDAEQLHADFDRLRLQAERDRVNLTAAGQRDAEQIQQRLRLEPLHPDHLSDYLLGPELHQRLTELAKWVNWGREHLPRQSQAAEPVRQRGVDVTRFGLPPGPDFLVRQLNIDGQTQHGADRIAFVARLTNLTAQPERHDQPLALHAELRTPALVEIDATLDRRGAVPHDRIVVQCPALAQPQRVLGKAEQLAVVVSPSTVHWAMFLDFQGEQLTGQVVLRQTPVNLMPSLGSRYGGERLAATLQAALSRIRSVEAMVDISGTIEKPCWRFASNVGPQLIEAVNATLQNELQSRRDALTKEFFARAKSELQRIEEVLGARQQAVLAKLQLNQQDVQQLAQLVARKAPGAQAIVDKAVQGKLPGDLNRKLPELESKLQKKLPPMRF